MFELLRIKLLSMEESNKNVIIIFDEMSLRQDEGYSNRFKQIIPAHKKVQVAIVRGLRKSFLHVVYYQYDEDMTTETLNTLIKRVEKAGGKVRAICCDMGNKKLLGQLGVNRRKRMYFFQNPSRPESKVFLVLPFWHNSRVPPVIQ